MRRRRGTLRLRLDRGRRAASAVSRPPRDFISFLAAHAHTNSGVTLFQRERDSVLPGSVGIQTYEAIAEIDHGARVTPWLVLCPHLQYVMRPSGTGAIPNALVAGLYAQVMF